ncbi:hypothetical protein PISMIDRAFT_689519 [Pisolithus microcarpus 441]|uniref:Uncharacterized protein n=1 Tax=Pisolithus microcarpus 441 TaxID=765257 RepID=A0A0C9YPS4_9AGAM|nr:hypothetical protein BKA83DRAFT_689519 [Pisolithus microcarpus]KIK12377.1 hypothetical protein PISMIDRAFT_689519 [Pisolithus microcarpus 441]
MASTERLATSLGCSFDGSLRDTPATITPGVADTGVGSEVEEHREKPPVPPPQDATATSTDRGAQADTEEFRAAFPKDVEKSTSKSEPRLDHEPHPTAVSDDSDEMRTQSRKDRENADLHDVSFRSRSTMRDSPTPAIVEKLKPYSLAGFNRINSVSRLNVSEKRHPLGDPKPLSPTLPPGRSQTRAGDSLSVQESSSTERVATGAGRSFDGSLRGTPATITSEVADTGIGSAFEENREQREVLPRQSATATSTDRGAQADREEFRAASQKDVCDL